MPRVLILDIELTNCYRAFKLLSGVNPAASHPAWYPIPLQNLNKHIH